jgi:hypothetical protein
MNISLQRCAHHEGREAAARCPHCGRFFCWECVTEHEDRVICAACLRQLPGEEATRGARGKRVLALVQAGGGLLLAWFFFYWLGRVLLWVPSDFHEGTVWREARRWIE